ncbi:MAG TPA: hypothetical protein VLT32_21910 [Candidatus Sulfomarinibacteraceae bacterium]|nr:hypothetical protein [Candidatus Sulfomarinibacteraceae bacterium]
MATWTTPDGLLRREREWWIKLAVAAGVIVTVAILAAILLGERGAATAPTPAPLSSRIGLAARAALVALGSSEEELEAARADLLGVFDARSGDLPEEGRAALVESLAIIEGQIAAISDELTRDPDNTRLARLLAEAYRRELELLQMAAGLPAVPDADTGAS